MPAATNLASADANFVRARLARIVTIIDRGLRAEARGACADLLFDFQPLVVADPMLVTLCDRALLDCGATALRFRFMLAVLGEQPQTRPHDRTQPGTAEPKWPEREMADQVL